MDEDFIRRVTELYLQYGIRSVTMDDIARHLGMSKKTIYQIVKDKEDLVNNVLHFLNDNQYDKLDRLKQFGDNAIQQLAGFWVMDNDMCQFKTRSFSFDLFKYYPHLLKPMVKQKRKKVINFLEINLTSGVEQGLYMKDLDVFMVSRLMVSTVFTLMDSEVFDLNYVVQPDFPQKVGKLYLNAILSDKGRKYIAENQPIFKEFI